MSVDQQNLLDVLKAELEFIKKGGYRHTARAAWRPHFMFQDSPTCLNFDPTKPRRPCNECMLTPFVPKDLGKTHIPCRYIPLNERGETVDSFYRSGTHEELEFAVAHWLKSTIERLQARPPARPEQPEVQLKAKSRPAPRLLTHGREVSMFSTCANPDCRTPFDYHQGRLFRFHKEYQPGQKPPNTHSVQHFWLCCVCCQKYTLEYRDHYGVLLTRRPDTPWIQESPRLVAAA